MLAERSPILHHRLGQRRDAPVDVGRGEVVVEAALDERHPLRHQRVGEQRHAVVRAVRGDDRVIALRARRHVGRARRPDVGHDQELRRQAQLGEPRTARARRHAPDALGAVTHEREAERREPAPRPCVPVIGERRAVQEPADVHPRRDVARFPRVLEAVERELRFRTGLARADEDEAAVPVAGEPLELRGKRVAVRFDRAILVDLGEPHGVAAYGEHAARPREVGTGVGVGAVEPPRDEHEEVARLPRRRCERAGERGVEPRAERAVARQPLHRVGEERRCVVEILRASERRERLAQRRRVAALERRQRLRLRRRVGWRRGGREREDERRREAGHAVNRGTRRGRPAPSSARSRTAP
jgi:hypothetical protein